MTKDDLYYYTQIKKSLEFEYNGKKYQLFYDKDQNNKDIIKFGQLYEPKTFDSFGELYNKAKIENFFLKDFLKDINL